MSASRLGKTYAGTAVRRLGVLFSREEARGARTVRTALFRLPATCLGRLSGVVVDRVNRHLYIPYANLERLCYFHARHSHMLKRHFYVIAMPGKFRLLEPCLELIGDAVNIFIILNGVRGREADMIRRRFPHIPCFSLATPGASSMSHGDVINLLLYANRENFGLIDYDLYIYNRDIFDRLHLKKNEFVAGAYPLRNRRTGIIFRATHLLYLNTRAVKAVMKKYRIGAQIYTRIPARIQPALERMGLGYDNCLKDYLHFFDPLNLVFAMALFEGFAVRIIEMAEGDMFHMGCNFTRRLLKDPEKAGRLLEEIRSRGT